MRKKSKPSRLIRKRAVKIFKRKKDAGAPNETKLQPFKLPSQGVKANLINERLQRQRKTRAEISNEIEWFRDLLDTLNDGDYVSAQQAIVAALKLLEREYEQAGLSLAAGK